MVTTDQIAGMAINLSRTMPRDLITLSGLGADRINAMCDLADTIRNNQEAARKLAANKVLGSLFFQPSTRTRLNFEAAIIRLGGSITGFASGEVTRAGDFYQETLEDVVAFTSRIVDVIALRHQRSGAAADAAKCSIVPLISAGDGYNEHPTQGLGDIYTMRRLLGDLSGRSIGLVGDSKIRSLKSIVAGLAQMKIGEVRFLLPPDFDLDRSSANALNNAAIPFRLATDVRELLSECDLVETIGTRHPNHNSPREAPAAATTPDAYKITRRLLDELDPPPVLHPGPRTDEIETSVDSHPAAKYFEQAENGLWMRAAILACALAPKADIAEKAEEVSIWK